jgi:hypothetical protein
MATQEQIESFYRFAKEQLANGGSDRSVDELYDQWRYQNLTPDELAENVAAIQASIDDMKNGHPGRDASEVEREIRDGLRLPEAE